MHGQAVCRMHGGKTPGAEANAKRRIAEAEAEKVIRKLWDKDAAPITDWAREMEVIAGRLSNGVNVLGELLDEGELDSVQATAFTRLLREHRQMLADMGRLDLDGRRVRLAEGQAAMVQSALLAVFEVWGPTPEQRDRAIGVFLAALGRPQVHDGGATSTTPPQIGGG